MVKDEKDIEDYKTDLQISFIAHTIALILMIISVCLYCGWIEVPDNSYNVTEHIVEKKSVYTYKFMDNGFEYFIFTENYCFEVDIGSYNNLRVNDSVIVTVDNIGSGSFRYDNHRFLSE